MKKLILFLCVIAGMAHADFPFAKRIRCEVNADGNEPVELEGLRWMQGTTPLVQLDVYRDGRPVTGVDTGTVARMVIGPTSTGTYYAASTNYTATNGAFLVQWPTVGTNSSTNVWWYTVFFERGGYRYWTGAGELRIEKTTSTAEDGLVWQTNTTCAAIAAAVDAHNADAAAHAGSAAAATNALAQVGTATATATNALALAQSATGTAAAASAALVVETNRAQVAEAGINSTATNALAIVQSLQAAGHITGAQASNITASIMSTGTAHYATTAGGIAFEGEGSSMTVIPSNGVLHVRTVTNSVNVYVSATTGAGYNGPAVGVAFSYDSEDADAIYYVPDSGFSAAYDKTIQAWQVWDTVVGPPPSDKYWQSLNVPVAAVLPNELVGGDDALGTLTLDWVPVTNTYTLGDMSGYLTNIAVNGVTGTVANGIAAVTIEAGGGGATGATNYAAWVSSLAWREVSGVYTSGSSCAVLAAAVTEYDEAWSVLFTCTNAQQVARLAAPASGAPLDATQAVVRASWWARDIDDVLHVWPSWSVGTTNTLTASATNAVQVTTWTNAAGSGSWFLDARVTGNDGEGRTALPKLEVIWQ